MVTAEVAVEMVFRVCSGWSVNLSEYRPSVMPKVSAMPMMMKKYENILMGFT